MSDKSTALMAQIKILRAQRDDLTKQLEPLFTAVQREDLREATVWAHRLIAADGADIPDWEQTATPFGQMLQDVFPRIDDDTMIDDLITQGGVHTWEFAELHVDRILAL